ncbi:MAG: hypothetical protein CME62_14415 [Halobacteriovoraceae bacterium]|nr:hypothetical protein [Halobacteriovoraceae bacterium]
MKYEISKDRDEILKTISASNNKNRNILWQNYNDHRKVVEIHNIQIDPIQEMIAFTVLESSGLLSDRPIYIKLNHRNLIFKGSILNISQGNVLVQIPDEIKLEEFREYKRFAFESNEKRKVILSFDSHLVNKAKENLPIQMLDVSQSGLGVIVNYFEKEKLIKSQNLSLSTLGHFKFHSHFYMNPVYKTNYQDISSSEDMFKIGYKFEEQLPDNLIENFIRAQEGIFESELGFLGKSRKFQRKLHREYRAMVKKLEAKKEFDDFFIGHGDFRNIGHEYLPKHIRLLSMFSCALANLLNINSKLLTQQLTYIAFVHDIAYFNNPRLAQIKDDKHFKKIAFLLKVHERELYYRAPQFALQFAKADVHAPVGAEQLLQQIVAYKSSVHPDKFLAMENLAAPLAIFVTAHHLVDYVLKHPHWSFFEYLENYPFGIYGGTFLDIYDKLKQARIAAA